LLRTILFWTIAVLSFLILAPAALLLNGNQRHAHAIQKLWAHLLLRVSGVTLTVKGLNHIQPYGSYVVMANHQSYMDIFVLLSLPLFIHWMAKKELFRIPLFGWILKVIGGISIDRQSSARGFSSIKQASHKIRSGATVLIFPEGTRSTDGGLMPFSEGGFFLAILSQAVILPATIVGICRIMPKGSFRISPGPVSITISEPIPTAGLRTKDRNDLQEKIRQIIARALENSNREE